MQVAALEMAFKQIGADAVAAAMGKLSKSFDEATAEGKKTDAMMGKLTDAAKKLVAGFAVGATMKKFIDATADAQNVQAQLAAGLRSTGFASGQTVEALNAQAEALMRLSTFDDEAIGGAQSLLLTFTKISGDTFPKATQAVLNMATRMGGDLQGAAIQVGKALQDPIAGVTALGRAGVQFTDAQKAVIAEMVETNRLAEAQRVVLAELETQFGGSAEAARNTLGGAVQYLKNQFDNLFELNPGQAAPIITSINALADALQPIATLINGLIVSIVGGGATMVKALNNIFLAFMRVVNRVVQFLSEVGGVVVKVLAMFTGNLTAEFDRSVNNWLKGFDYTEEALIEQQNEWKAWENGIYESLAGVRRETAKPIAPPPVSGAAGGGVGGSRVEPNAD